MKIYKFYADWCMPCKQLSKKIDNSDLKNVIISINCDEDEELCNKYNVKNIPTILVTTDNGIELGRISGNVTIKNIAELISECTEAENSI